jgi:molecular chaperone DnaK
VDANGILNVSARDKDTGAEQQITISESSNLDRGEVERMVAEAQRNQAEDQRIRQQVDARNELDAVAYQVERQLAEGGDAIPSHERARAEMLVTDARQAIKEEAPLERLRTLTGELQQALQGLMLAASGSGGGRPGGPSQPPPGGDDDVIDADFTPS